MVTARLQGVVRRLRQTALCEQSLSDGELLERYLAQRDEAAFAALVRRHGPMVLGVCRRVLADAHDADDAFQATFLVLVRKAHAILPRERVGPWLYGVAYRTSLKAKTMNSRRRAKLKALVDVPSPDVPAAAAATDTDWLALLDQEVSRLPDKYRLPIVLCDLEGKTRKQAARQLGWPEGTVSTRLQHGRALVHKRLTRRGVTLSAGAMTLAWAQAASAAAVPGPLVTSTIQTASAFAAGKFAGIVPLKIVALTQGVLHAMVLSKIKNASALLLLVGVLGFSLAGLSGGIRPATAQELPLARDPAVTRADPPVETVQRPMEINQGRLPTGPAPVQALVSLDKDKVVVKTNQPFYQPRTTIDGAGRPVTFYEAVFALRADRYDRSAVEVYDTSRRKLDNKDMAKWLKEEIPALVMAGSRPIDPLHLRLIKEGTLIFVLPVAAMPATGYEAPPPAMPEGWPQAPRAVTGVPPTTVPLVVPAIPPPAPAIENPPIATSPIAPPTAPAQPSPRAQIEQAERELAIAEFYLKIGQRGSAAFYYEMIRRRYPGTLYAQRAAQLLQELPRQQAALPPAVEPPARVGEIIIRGNRRVPDAVILENLPLYPGQVLNYNDLRVAEHKLAQLDAFVNAGPVVRLQPAVTVLESSTQFKDILITVQESLRLDVMAEMKKLQGVWTIVSISGGGMEKKTPDGPDIVIVGDRLTTKSKQGDTGNTYTLDLSVTPKRIRLNPYLQGAGQTSATNPQPSSGTYELDGDTLKLTLETNGPKATMILKRKRGTASQSEPTREDSKSPESPSDPRTPAAQARHSQVKLDFPSTGLSIVAAELAFVGDDCIKLTDATVWKKGAAQSPHRIQGKVIVIKLDGPVRSVADLGTRQIVSLTVDAISFSADN